MMTRILFRLPNDNIVHQITSSFPGTPLNSVTQINERSGYLLAPFAASINHPILLITPEQETSFPLPSLLQHEPITFHYNEEESYLEYKEAFTLCLKHLAQPPLKKIVLSRTLRLQLHQQLSDHQLKQLFVAAAHRYPQAYVALIQSPEAGNWLIATPELLLEEREGVFHTMALAATLLHQEGVHLQPEEWGEKNIEEQRIVADYIHECLKQLQLSYQCSPLHIHTAGELSHLCTRFTIAPLQISLGQILDILHPTPAVCGVPTAQSVQLLTAIESHPRRYYAGFSGPIGLKAGTHLYVTLRCLSISGKEAMLYAGAGLLADSDFQSEWEETRHKMQTMLSLLQ